MARRKTGKAQVKVKRDANGRLVQIGGDRETVKAKPSSRHGSGVGAGLGVHYLVEDASGRLVVCDNIGHVLSGTRINSIDIDGRISLWRGNGIRSVSFALLIEPRKFLEGLVQYPNCTRVEVARIYPSFKSTKFTANYSLDKLIQNGLPDDTYGMILYFSRNGEVNYRLTARLSFTDRTLTLTGDDDYVAALVHWLNAR
jgi:hypothetical protein